MIKYCKAYKLEDLRKFSGWATASLDEDQEVSDDDLAFVWENLTVTKSCFAEEDYLLETVTSEWEAFCRHELQYAVPEDLQEAQNAVQPSSDASNTP